MHRLANIITAAAVLGLLAGCGDDGERTYAGPEFHWERIATDDPAWAQAVRGSDQRLVLAEPDFPCCTRVWTWAAASGFAEVDVAGEVAPWVSALATDGEQIAISGGVDDGDGEQPVLLVGPTEGPLITVDAPGLFTALYVVDGDVVGLNTDRAGELTRGEFRSADQSWTFGPVDAAGFAPSEESLALDQSALSVEALDGDRWVRRSLHVTHDGRSFREVTMPPDRPEDFVIAGSVGDTTVGYRLGVDDPDPLWVERAAAGTSPLAYPGDQPISRVAFGSAGLLVVADSGQVLFSADLDGEWRAERLDPSALGLDGDWWVSVNEVVAVDAGFVLQVIGTPPEDPGRPEGTGGDDRKAALWYLTPVAGPSTG